MHITLCTVIGDAIDSGAAATKNLGKYKLIIIMNDTWGITGDPGRRNRIEKR